MYMPQYHYHAREVEERISNFKIEFFENTNSKLELSKLYLLIFITKNAKIYKNLMQKKNELLLLFMNN